MSPIAPCSLPTELVNLLALHSSFITALSLHYAHNGASTPADLRDLTASVTLVWRQRKVTYDDIRLIIGVLDSSPSGKHSPFYLSDYGRGKICLEIKDQSTMINGMAHMNEEALQNMFKDGLDCLWARWREANSRAQKTIARPIATPRRGRGRARKADTKQATIEPFMDETSIPKFISQLPLADITTCASLTALAPLQEKGRKRLREFKESQHQGRVPKKARETSGKENQPALAQYQQLQPVQAKMTEFTSVRKANLLERVLAKQAAAEAGPAAPSPAELQRKAALQRAEDVLGVLSLLCASKPGMRVSFSMAALVQSLKASIRTPISKEEAMKCVEVLASEVAPGYVSIVNIGAISSVVVNRAMRPVDIKNRLVALNAA